MTVFVRKNLLVCTGVFLPASGSATPSAATVNLSFKNMSGVLTSEEVPLTLGTDGVTWTGTWDSSQCVGGDVEWAIWSTGDVQAAQQGKFTIKANRANTL